MTQESPDTALYSKIVAIIDDIKRQYAAQNLNDPTELAKMIAGALTDSRLFSNRAFTNYEPILESEVPSSEKMNRFWRDIEKDFNILQNQVDVIRAWAVFNYNRTKTDILKSRQSTDKLQNKLTTLQMYSSAPDPSIVLVGDVFINDEFINWDDIPESARAEVYPSNGIGLAINAMTEVGPSDIDIKILPTSNGFLGNNQEIFDPDKAPKNKQGEKIYHFKGERNRKANVRTAVDTESNTWFEYECYKLTDKQKTQAQNMDFQYFIVKGSGENVKKRKVNWADGPDGDVLKLNMQFDLKARRRINVISVTPHNLAANANNPIKITSVSYSANGTDWIELSPKNVWVVSSINRSISKAGDETIALGTATWELNNRIVRYVRVFMEQLTPIQCNVGHLYYIKKQKGENPIRVRGPIPELTNGPEHYRQRTEVPENKRQKLEYFVGKRWVIGLRDVSIASRSYAETGLFVSKRFDIPGIVDRVSLDADMTIPNSFGMFAPDDSEDSGDEIEEEITTNGIRFYISPDDGRTWHRIGRIQDDSNSIPEIIAFNDPIPVEMRESGVEYVDVDGDVTSVKLKVIFDRPEDKAHLTPILRSYTLKVKKR